MTNPSPRGTPKRKRAGDEPTTPSPIKFSFDLAKADPVEDGSKSPRSVIAHRFHGLALGSASGATARDVQMTDSLAKRAKQDQATCSVEAGHPNDTADRTEETTCQADMAIASIETPQSDYSHRTSSSAASLEQPKPKRKRRAGTPPLRFRKGPIMEQKDGAESSDEETQIVDPVRASLTWHDDEITIYDPDDEDDDGTGINGIGFKPTPALAHVRTMKRRQQMADYRKREDSEARARRNLRRRGAVSAAEEEGSTSPRKVRFLDAERQKTAITTR